jgi:hypothetical protein
LTITCDVPAARKHKSRVRTRAVEYSLGRACRIVLDPPRYEHGEHAVAAPHRRSDDVAVIGGAGHDGNPIFERVELGNAVLPTHADHLVAAVESVLNHVTPELSGRPDDADLLYGHDFAPTRMARCLHDVDPKETSCVQLVCAQRSNVAWS